MLQRQLLVLVQPIGLVWLALLALTVALWWKGQRTFASCTAALALFVQVIGGTDLPDALLRSLERLFAGVKIEELPRCDALILLGGGVEPSRYEAARVHLSGAGDRVMMALELLRLGKAPVLCIGGGSVSMKGETWSEASFAKAATVERNLTSAEVVSLGICRDTHDEALRVRALAEQRGWHRVLVVTSAAHQRRALATFRTAGLEAVPGPCNFLTSISLGSSGSGIGIPSYGGFARFAVWLHEQIGWWEYRRRGWIDPALCAAKMRERDPEPRIGDQ